ncbi:hypothetical protein [Sinosporangium siamense]|uniref:Uncharacterized protein n=1 Tax=Sinosporangium siamense TaxID=1367973 RepID=A0A919V5F7_9ACTN|nr:hypothetical protein [Sinosporangium siamense]GII91503.1 hypothetical protein Ssi02_17340 [Sinosporangium siamense]
MFPVSYRRGLLTFAAASVLVLFTAACGGSGEDTSAKPAAEAPVENKAAEPASGSGGGDTKQICRDAMRIGTDSMGDMQKLMSDPTALNTTFEKLSGQYKDLAAKADGELAGALNKFAEIYSSLKVDMNNPQAAMTQLTDVTTKAQEAGAALTKACV